LISAYDKQVFEKQKFSATSRRAARLQRWESRLFQSSEIVLADTSAHAHFFSEVLGADPNKVFVVPVGAEETLFVPQTLGISRSRPEVLFYGSFVPLQGVDVIVEAARRVPEVDWTLLGQGKLRAACEESAKGLSHVRFEDWVPYEQLAARIGQADLLLGIFGDTPKALRVIPNKFYQAIACARPIITMNSPVYGAEVRSKNQGGIAWVPPADPSALAQAVREWAGAPERLLHCGANARKLYEQFYANDQVLAALRLALSQLATFSFYF
jgi:glycosyltransferase involved in cell wall biosynthesis